MLQLTKYHIKKVESPFWAFAIHDGHLIDPSLEPFLKINEDDRLREEDPFTALMAELPINQFIVASSRFQLDLNRQISDAVYLKSEQSWGLHVWDPLLPKELIERLYAEFNLLYRQIEELVKETIDKFGYFVLFDVHSYNCRRESPSQIMNFETDPQINLGTAYVNPRWDSLVKILLQFIENDILYDNRIDVRENIKFKGGYLSQRINQLYGNSGCVLSFEFRKDFMDEWTGCPDLQMITSCKQLLIRTLGALKNYYNHDRKE